MNIFFVIDGKVITPATDGAILKGITRDCAITILRDAGYTVEERLLSIDEVVAAHQDGVLQEAFGTGTAAVVAHVARIGYKDNVMELPPLTDRKVGSLVKKTIDGLRAGTIEDKYNWIVPVKAPTAVAV